MLQPRNGLTTLLGPGGWLSIALLAVAVFLFFTQLASAQQTSTQPAISVPALTAQSSSGAVDLSWTAVTGAERYELWVWDSVNEGRYIGGDSLTGTTYTHADVTVGTTYHYAIRTVNADGQRSAWSEYVSVTVPAPPGSVPALTAQPGAGEVVLSWTVVTSAQRYELWVWDSVNQGRYIGGNSLTGTSYTHTGVAAGTTYHYTIHSVNADGQYGPWSEYVSATPLQEQQDLQHTATPTATNTSTPSPTPTITPTPRAPLPPPPSLPTQPGDAPHTATPTATNTSTPSTTPTVTAVLYIYVDVDIYTDSHTYAGGLLTAGSATHSDANGHANSYTDSHADGHTDCYTDNHADGHADRYTDRDGHTACCSVAGGSGN